MKWVKKNSGGGQTAENYSRPVTYSLFKKTILFEIVMVKRY